MGNAAALQNYFHVTTDDTLRETLTHGSGSYPFAYYLEDIWQYDFHCVDWHWHYEVELLTVEKGRASCLVGEEQVELSEGFGLFVNSGILHRYEACESGIVPNILFSPALFAEEKSLIYEKYVLPVLHSAPCQVLDPKVAWQKEMLQIMSAIYKMQQEEKNELRTMRHVVQLWELLAKYLEASPASSGVRHTDHRQAKLLVMMQYIHDHYSEPVTLEEIAGAAAVSKSSALNLFQAGIHSSPVAYLIQYRLKQAGELLYTTEKTVSAIAEEVGFSSAGYFCRKFREHYHMSPIEYRRVKVN